MSVTPPIPRCPLCGLEHVGELPAVCARPGCGVELGAGTGERLRPLNFRLTEHYSLCVLPFTFAEPVGLGISERLTVSGRWRQRVFSPEDADDVERTEYFLPYIRRFLFPEFAAATSVEDRAAVRPTCRHFRFDLSQLGEATDAGLPLTLVGRDRRKNLPVEHPLLLESVELIVFSYRVGFLVLRFRGTAPGVTYFDQMEALAYLRTIAPLYRDFEMPELVTATARHKMETLLPFLLTEFGPVEAAPATTGLRLPVKPTYDDRMMVYTFSCLDRDSIRPDERQNRHLLERHALVPFDAKASAGRPRDLNADPDAWLRSRWQGFEKDGGSLVVFNTDRYHARYLGVYHATYYFDIFLLAALQRVNLLSLFDRFSNIQQLITGSRAGRTLLRRVRRDLLLFKNQCWFSQITNRERGLTLWKKWQKVFETRTLLREVNEQSDELNTYLQARHRERVEWLVKIGGFLAAAVPVVLGLERFLGQEGWTWLADLRWVLLGVLVIGAAAFAYRVAVRPSEEE